MHMLKTVLILSILSGCLAITNAFADDLADDNSASDDMQYYHIYDDIDLVSTLKIEYAKPRIVIKKVYPQLQGDNENENEITTKFNNLIIEAMQKEIDTYKNQLMSRIAVQQKIPKTEIKNEFYVDYDSSTLYSGHNRIISVRLSFSGVIAGLAHPYHYHRVLNFNLDTGNVIQLSDLFKPEENYLSTLSNYTSHFLLKRLPNKEMILAGTKPTPENYQNWNLKPHGIVLTFDEYQVAPYVEGAQTVLIPYSALKTILSSESPIASCITHRSRCTSNNLLTGGFMDEAVNVSHRRLNPMLS